MTAARRLSAGTLLLAALASVPVSAYSVPHRGDAAPSFDLPRLGGGKLGLAALRGKPVYVSFFATWCAPCNAEAPSIAQLERKYRPKGLVLLGVDEEESAAKAGAFAQKYALPFAVLLDDDGTMGQSYGAIGLPVHVFIDRSGKISTYRLGEMTPAEIENAIRQILTLRQAQGDKTRHPVEGRVAKPVTLSPSKDWLGGDYFDRVGVAQVDASAAAFFDLAAQDRAGERVGDEARDRARDVARAASGVEALGG